MNNIYKTPALSLRTSEGDEIWLAASLGMAVTLADCQHFGNDHRWISPQKVMRNFGAIIYTPIFRNRGKKPKGSVPPYM